MPHLTTSSTRTFNVHRVRFTSFASSASGAAQLAAWRADFDAHTPGKAHRLSCEEVLFVLSGALDIELDEDAFTAQSGDVVLVPQGTKLRVSNTRAEPAQAWVTTQLGMSATIDGSVERLTPPWAQ